MPGAAFCFLKKIRQFEIHMIRFLLSLGAGLLLASQGVAAFSENTAKRPITAQDLWAMQRVGTPRLSPDGRLVVFTVQSWSIERNRSTTHLWLVEAAEGAKPRQLTRAVVASDGSPQWSPDGKRIAFLSKRADDAGAALYVIPVDGGEAERIVDMPLGIALPRWMPDGKSIVFATKVYPDMANALDPDSIASTRKEAKRRKESKMTAHVTENRVYRYWDHWQTELMADKLALIDLASRKVTDLTPQSDTPWQVDGEAQFELSPDGSMAALVRTTGRPPYQERPYNHIWLVPTDGSGTWKDLTPEAGHTDANPVFAPDGKSLLVGRRVLPIYAGESQKLFRITLADGRAARIGEKLDYSFDDWGYAKKGELLWVVAEEKGHVPVHRLEEGDGGSLVRLIQTGTCSSIDASDSVMVFAHDTAMRPAELFLFDLTSGKTTQLTHFNAERMSMIDLGHVESHTTTGAEGHPVQMWLTYPPNYDPTARYPLVQLMHGGPHTMVRDSWSYRWNAHLFAAPGYFAVWVNRHGSTGFGEKFTRSILGEWGKKPLEDILRATDYLTAKFPSIDSKRVAAAGASYGGYMATWVLGHTDRFVCIINHAGVSDFIGQMGCDMSYTFTATEVLGGTPWEDMEGMQRNNPIAFARHFKTPMMIIHGEMDYRVPFGQALTLYNVLKAMNVQARFLSFPNENHWILTPQNSIYWNYEVQQWLARYLGGKPMEKPVFAAESTN